MLCFDVKLAGSAIDEKFSFKILDTSFSSKLDYDSYTVSIAKTALRKTGALIHFSKHFSPEVALRFYKFIIGPSMEHCCHV